MTVPFKYSEILLMQKPHWVKELWSALRIAPKCMKAMGELAAVRPIALLEAVTEFKDLWGGDSKLGPSAQW